MAEGEVALKCRLMQFPRCAGVALVVVTAVAACSGSSTALPACPPLVIPAFYLVSPSAGATGVPDNLREIVFAGFPLGPVKLTGGTQSIALKLEPAPTPTPTPENALPQSIARLAAPLSASTTYTAKYTYTVSGNDCSPWTATFVAGSFRTQ
jgi:hypothetical protein